VETVWHERKKKKEEKNEQRESSKAVILAIAVGKSDDCVFMLYSKERSNTFWEEGTWSIGCINQDSRRNEDSVQEEE